MEASVRSDYNFILLDRLIDTDETGIVASHAQMERRDVEVSLVLDISTSMRGARLREAKLASKSFTSVMLHMGGFNSETRIALVPFGGTVRLPAEMSHMVQAPPEGLKAFSRHWIDKEWNGCLELSPEHIADGIDLDSTYGPVEDFFSWTRSNPWCPKKGNEILALSTDETTILNQIDTLTLSDGTGTVHGMLWGVETLNPQWVNRFPNAEPSTPANNDRRTKKVIILMSDGGITAQHHVRNTFRRGKAPYNSRKKERVSERQSQNAFKRVCKRARREGITVYTIGYMITNKTDSFNLAKCASSPDHHIDASSGDLTAIFNAIAQELSPLRLTQ